MELDWSVRGTTDATCPCCGKAGLKSALVALPEDGAADGKRIYYRCPECLSVFPFPFDPPAQSAYGASPLSVKHYAEIGAGISALTSPLEALAEQRKIRTFLDVGCGFGFTVDFARRILGWKAFGIEPGRYAEPGSKALGVAISRSLLGEGSNFYRRRFDLVSSLETIEHIQAPQGFLKLLLEVTEPTGVVHLTTPDAGCISPEQCVNQVLAALFPGGHAEIFSAQALRDILEKTGFGHVNVWVEGQHLRALASPASQVPPFHAPATTERYERYLEHLGRKSRNVHLRAGAQFRLYREYVNRGDFEAAADLRSSLTALISKTYKVDIRNRDVLNMAAKEAEDYRFFGGKYPFFLSAFLFYAGMQDLCQSSPGSARDQFEDAISIASAEVARRDGVSIEAEGLLPSMHYHFGLAALSSGDRTAALEKFQWMLDQFEGHHLSPLRIPEYIIQRVRYQAGISHLQLGQYEPAMSAFRKAIEMPEYVENPGLYGNIRHHAQLALGHYEALLGLSHLRQNTERDK